MDHNNISRNSNEPNANTAASYSQHYPTNNNKNNNMNTQQPPSMAHHQTAMSVQTQLAQQMLLNFVPQSLTTMTGGGSGIPSPIGLPQAASHVWDAFWQHYQQQQLAAGAAATATTAVGFPPGYTNSTTTTTPMTTMQNLHLLQHYSALAPPLPITIIPQQQLQPQPQPTYVNAKQYKRIMQRRKERNALEEYYSRQRQHKKRLAPNATETTANATTTMSNGQNGTNHKSNTTTTTTYQYESRHKHANSRPRKKGRFLKGDELEQYYREHPEEDHRKQRPHPPVPPPVDNQNDNDNSRDHDEANNQIMNTETNVDENIKGDDLEEYCREHFEEDHRKRPPVPLPAVNSDDNDDNNKNNNNNNQVENGQTNVNESEKCILRAEA